MRRPFTPLRLRRQLRLLRRYLTFDLQHGNRIVRQTDFTHCERPVLLITGFMSTRDVFNVLEQRLRKDGYGVFSIRLGGLFNELNTRGIEECAETVREKVEALYARYQLGPLSIIGFSKGGLIGHYYVKRLGGEQRVRTLLTLGTPHHGTRAAYAGILAAGLFSRSVWQMAPMSPFIRRLHEGPFPPSVRFVSIYSRDDGASPFPASVLETTQPNVFNVEVPRISHGQYLLKRAVYEIIRRELARGYAGSAALAAGGRRAG